MYVYVYVCALAHHRGCESVVARCYDYNAKDMVVHEVSTGAQVRTGIKKGRPIRILLDACTARAEIGCFHPQAECYKRTLPQVTHRILSTLTLMFFEWVAHRRGSSS